jgi:hypothetical protein
VYRTAANHFFSWAEDAGLSLDSLKPGHVTQFFAAMGKGWKASTAGAYFRSLRLLFGHLEADRIIERSPFVSDVRPQRSASFDEKQALHDLKEFLLELDGYREGSKSYRPGLIAMFPIFFGHGDGAGGGEGHRGDAVPRLHRGIRGDAGRAGHAAEPDAATDHQVAGRQGR